MLLKIIILISSLLNVNAIADNYNQIELSNNTLPEVLSDKIKLEKFQTLIIKDLVINCEKNIKKFDFLPIKKESFFKKLSLKTSSFFKNLIKSRNYT
jgi:hypothetical protein